MGIHVDLTRPGCEDECCMCLLKISQCRAVILNMVHRALK